MDNEKLDSLLKQIMDRFDKIERMLERMMRVRDCLDGEKLLDNQDMCTLLGITKRTLARYRQHKKVSYYMINKKVYYKASEVKEFLARKGKQ